MNEETIEKAARKELKGVVPAEWNQEPFIDIFVNAARWRINSVWHSTNELPKHSGYLAVLMNNGLLETMHYTVGIGFHEMHLKGYALWAYIDDLLPERKEEAL